MKINDQTLSSTTCQMCNKSCNITDIEESYLKPLIYCNILSAVTVEQWNIHMQLIPID